MGRYFQFKVLPIGLSSACYAFTKLLRPLVEKWRSMGDKSYTRTKEIVNMVAQDLTSLGLTINFEKSSLTTAKIGNWFGFIIGTSNMTFAEQKEKIQKFGN